MSVRDNITAGVYNTTLDYPNTPKKPTVPPNASPADYRAHATALEQYEIDMVEFRKKREAYYTEQGTLENQFRDDLEHENRMNGHPKASLLWGMAWDKGHSSGYSEVANWYEDLVELAR